MSYNRENGDKYIYKYKWGTLYDLSYIIVKMNEQDG